MFGRKKPPARPPVNMPKQGTPLTGNQRARQEKLANANAANNRQSPLSVNPLIKPASMSQLRAGANAIRGLPQGSKQTSTRPGMSVTDAIKRASSSFNASNAPKKVASSIFNRRGAPTPTPVNKNQASMSQLQAGANAIRGLQQGSQQSPTSIAQQNPLAGKNIKDIRSMGTAFGFPGKKPGMKAGGKVSSASSRGDGCAVKGKTKGKMV
jgi:hypothetical protein